jgi:hypothetical protein
MRNLFATVQGGPTRGISADFRCDLTIKVLAHPIPKLAAGATNAAGTGDVAMQFKVYNAWPTAIAYSDLNAGDNSLLVEQMTLVHEGFDVSWSKFTDGTFTPAASITEAGAQTTSTPGQSQAV